MTRTAIGRWLRASAAVAAAAALHSTAPAAQAAVTPCSDPSGVVAQGYIITKYLQVRYDRLSVSPSNGGVKVCFQVGDSNGLPGGDRYGVIDIPVPAATVAPPQVDGEHQRCKEHPYNQNLLTARVPAAGGVRIDFFDGPNWDAVCWEVFDSTGAVDHGGRLVVHGTPASVSGDPQIGFVTPSPIRDMAANGGYAPGYPSGDCSNDPGGVEITNFYAMGRQFRLAYSSIDLLGRTSVCARTQDAVTHKGFGGRASVDTSRVPSISHSRDGSPCGVEHASLGAADDRVYLWIGSSPLSGNGTQSICVKDTPTNTNRIDITPSVNGIVTFTPDPDTP